MASADRSFELGEPPRSRADKAERHHRQVEGSGAPRPTPYSSRGADGLACSPDLVDAQDEFGRRILKEPKVSVSLPLKVTVIAFLVARSMSVTVVSVFSEKR